jgi:hypothetical protein
MLVLDYRLLSTLSSHKTKCHTNFYSDPKMPKLILSAGGLFLFFLMYGVVQERIMTKPYGVDEVDVSICFCNCFFFFVVGYFF